jgi:nucleotide-binding universal stress UspA family protein
MPEPTSTRTIRPSTAKETRLSTGIIVSYDGTPNDDDALALAKLLERAGGPLALAYVRHSREFDPAREAVAQDDAERRLRHGAEWLGAPDIAQHVVVAASTGQGLLELAIEEKAQLIVFGSDYRTPPGRVEPQTTAQYLLDHGKFAVAIAPAGLRARHDDRLGLVATIADGDPAATQTAEMLATAFGTSLTDSPMNSDVGLIVVGSSPGAKDGRVALSGSTRSTLESARAAVVVVPRNRPLLFPD